MADKIQFRRDTAARWAEVNPILLSGEIGLVTDSPNKYKLGNGVNHWNDLPLQGFNGTLVDIPGTDSNSAMSQKGATDLVSEYNVSANNSNAEYTFAQAVALVPASLQKGGLTIKYIDSTTHKYAIKRLMSSTWNTTESNWQGIDDEPTTGSDNLVKSGGVQNELVLGAVYDVSAKNPTAGPNNDGKWESLSALLSDANLSTLIPTSVRKGGMSIKFIQSSDNKYVQYLYKDTNTNNFTFLNNWEKINIKEELMKSSLSPYYINFNLSELSNEVFAYYRNAIKKIDNFIDIEIMQYPAPLEKYYMACTFTSSNAEIGIKDKTRSSVIILKPKTATAPFSASSFEDRFENYTIEVSKGNYDITISAKINWYQLYLNECENFGAAANILYKKIFPVRKNLQFYPFVSGTTTPQEVFSPIKDVYIPNRDDSKYYFIWGYYTTQTSYYQIQIGCYDKYIISPVSSDVTIVASFEKRRSTVTDDMKKSYQLLTASGCKLLFDYSEADKSNVNYWHSFIYGYPSIFQFDWHRIDRYSPILIDARFDGKQEKLISGTNIKTINTQSILGSGNLLLQEQLVSGTNIKTINSTSILGSGNIEVEGGGTDSYSDLSNKPSINNVELDGNNTSDSLGLQEKIVSGTNIKTINGQSIMGSGDIPFAAEITNNPDNVTLEGSNGMIRIKELISGAEKYGFKHIYNDITITSSNDVASWANCIVEIKGKVTFANSAYQVTFPQNVILYFNGGCFIGEYLGKVYPRNAFIIAEPYQIMYGNIRFTKYTDSEPIFSASVGYGEWFGAKGDGVTPDGTAFNKLNNVNCCKIQLLKKTYVLERNFAFSGRLLSGYGATIKRYSKFADVVITEPTTVSSSSTHTITVDTTSETYSELEVGMGVFIMNKEGESRSIVGGRWIISEINGASVTIIGNSMDAVYPANTKCLVTGFTLISLSGKNSKIEGVILDGGFNIDTPVYPLSRTPWEVDCTIGGGSSTSENLTIEDCRIVNSMADGIMVSGININMCHNTILHSAGNGIHLSGNHVVHIDNNYIFDSNLNPLTLHNEGAITYSNNIFEVTITNNVFDNCLTCIGSIDTADDCKSIIIGNIFRNFRTHGIQGSATNTSYGNITRQFIITNNRFIATQDDSASWETRYLYSPNIPRQEATGYGIYFNANNAYWKNLVINSNDFIDCGVCIKNSNNVLLNSNSIDIAHNFTGNTPNNVVEILTSTGVVHNNLIIVNSEDKTNCFVLTDSKISVKGNGYKLTNCTFTDTTYDLVTDNIDLT